MNDEPEWAARFHAKVLDLDLDSGCLVYLGGTVTGYGSFTISQELRLPAHRAAWLLAYGELPPPDKVLDHLCRHTWCVNVAHLEAVTSSENVLRGHNATAHRPDQTLCAKGLHPWVPSNLVRLSTGYMTCRECKRTQQRKAYARRRENMDD